MAWQMACQSERRSPSAVSHIRGVNEVAQHTFFFVSQCQLIRSFPSHDFPNVRRELRLRHFLRLHVLIQITTFTVSCYFSLEDPVPTSWLGCHHLSAGLPGAWAHWSRCRKHLAMYRARKTFASRRSVLSCMTKTPRQTFCALCDHTPSKPEGLLTHSTYVGHNNYASNSYTFTQRCSLFLTRSSLSSF